jgi:predicted phosphodiesterase
MLPVQDAALKRIGVIGDVHAEDGLLASALAWLQGQHVNALFCTGDLVTGEGDANRCCDLLQEANVSTVRGNHDRWFFQPNYPGFMPRTTDVESLTLANRLFLMSLPITLTFDTITGPLLLCHGTGQNDMLGVYPGDSEKTLASNHELHRIWAEQQTRFMVSGHTHTPMCRSLNHLTLINAGTLRRDRKPGFVLLDFTQLTACFYRLDPQTHAVSLARTVMTQAERQICNHD